MPATALGLTQQQFQTLCDMLNKNVEPSMLKVLEERVEHIRNIVERLEDNMAASTNSEVVSSVVTRCAILEARVTELSSLSQELRDRITAANNMIVRLLISVIGTLIVALGVVLWYFVVEQATPGPTRAKSAQKVSSDKQILHTGLMPENSP